ncbi:MAG: hypothetical protein ACRC78_04325 [Planktothrix sp.]
MTEDSGDLSDDLSDLFNDIAMGMSNADWQKPCQICRGTGIDPEQGDRVCWHCHGCGDYGEISWEPGEL